MQVLPIHKRKFHAFLSHAHADHGFVDPFAKWLRDRANIPIWYDKEFLHPSTNIATHLPEAIQQCRALLLILSKNSIASGWVQEEYSAALAQRTQFKDFRIIPIRIDDCAIPGFLTTTLWIDLPDGQFNMQTASAVLHSLYHDDLDLELAKTRDIYISRTWRDSEAPMADYVCKRLIEIGFRLIGDSEDQAGFGAGDRVHSIISSCGALVAILPDRDNGSTSKYMLQEIKIAKQQGIPTLVIAEDTVDLPEELAFQSVRLSRAGFEKECLDEARLLTNLERLDEEWSSSAQPHYVFFGTDFGQERQHINKSIKKLIRHVTAMPCIMGDDIRTGHIQQVIQDKISEAFLVIADITEENLNTCIEAGIARGARVPFHLVSRGPRHRPPFMFRDQQVWFYENEVDLLGIIHSLVFPYRRRVINYELA